MKHTLHSQIAIGSSAISLLAIVSLHFLTAEIDPTWHMISEYAYGEYGWVLSVFFFAWAVSYWATGLALWPLAKSWIAKLGVIFLLVSGVGALMGGIYDVRQPLHGVAFGLGVPFLPIVAPLLTRYLRRKYSLSDKYSHYFAHATWVSFILMAVAMGIFMSQMQSAGALNMETPQLITSLPEGVTPIIGYANRFLVLAYIGWLIAINFSVMKVGKN